MKIATYYDEIYLRKCAAHNFSSEAYGKDGPGVIPEILLPILDQMNVSYELLPVVKDFSGTCEKNGTWLPMNTTLLKLTNGIYDMIAMPLFSANMKEDSSCFENNAGPKEFSCKEIIHKSLLLSFSHFRPFWQIHMVLFIYSHVYSHIYALREWPQHLWFRFATCMYWQ